MDESHALPDDVTYVAEHVLVVANRKRLADDAGVVVIDGRLTVVLPGDGPVEERLLFTAPVDDVEVLGRPWWGLGQSVAVRFGEDRLHLQPDSVTQGTGLATPGKMRRAREAAAKLEAALAGAAA
jgi:hypothetical protein